MKGSTFHLHKNQTYINLGPPMRKSIIIGILLIVSIAYAGDEKDIVDELPPISFKQYTSAIFGNGSASEGGSMQWRTFELRIGSSIAPNKRLDFVHYNEGHPDNNHRDGFAIQAVYDTSIHKNIKLEVGVGPYLSFNTTTRNAVQYNDKHVGILGSAVVLYYLNTKSQNLHLRADYNHVAIREAHSSDAILVGIGMNFGEHISSEVPIQITIIGANFKTNRSGTDANVGGQIEVKQYEGENLALSVSLIQEGDDALVERSGVATQVWYAWPASESWTLSAGAGPYFTQNRLSSNGTELDGLISIEAEREVGDPQNGVSLLVRFSRIVTDDDIDRDIFAIGIAKKF